MRTGPDGNTRITREYQHTNRRVTQNTPTRASPPAGFQWTPIDEKIETSVPSPVDIFTAISAISTAPISEPATLVPSITWRRHRRVRCSWRVGGHVTEHGAMFF